MGILFAADPQSFGEILADYWWVGLIALPFACPSSRTAVRRAPS